jgi:hypothetical protein
MKEDDQHHPLNVTIPREATHSEQHLGSGTLSLRQHPVPSGSTGDQFYSSSSILCSLASNGSKEIRLT